MRTSVANIELNSNFVCVLDPEVCEINLVHWSGSGKGTQYAHKQ